MAGRPIAGLRACGLVAAWMLGALANAAHAQAIPSWHDEYTKRLKYEEVTSPLKDDLFGDNISLYDGTVTFSATDVSLTGNSALPVSIGRRYTVDDPGHDLPFGDWELDVPFLSGTFGADPATVAAGYWAPAARCNAGGAPPIVTVWNSMHSQQIDFYAMDYWDGNRLSLPGGGGGELLKPVADARRQFPQDGQSYPFTTKDGWHFSCLGALQSGQAGEGFIGHAPDGTRYYFDWMVVRNTDNPAHKQLYDAVTHGVLPRNQVLLYPSQIVDRFGNWVRYEWQGSQLKRIYANDGRQISLTYDGSGRIATVVAGTRQWSYAYDYPIGQLTTVTVPDGNQWVYAFNPSQITYKYPVVQGEPWTNYQIEYHLCTRLNKFAEQSKTLAVTHPSGAYGEFHFQPQRHGRMGVPLDCQETGADGTMQTGWNRIPVYKDAYSISLKRISGAGLDTRTWTYAYSALEGRYDRDTTAAGMPLYPVGIAPHKFTTVQEPGGNQVVYEFGKEVNFNDGRLLSTTTSRAGTTLRRDDTTYYAESDAATAVFAPRAGESLVYGSDYALAEDVRPVVRTTIGQDAVTFTNEVLQFDAHARPVKVRKSNSAGHARTDTTTYYDDLSRWVLGQVQRVVNDDGGIEVSRSEFDTTLDVPIRFYDFGQLVQSVGYNSDGTVATVRDGRNNTTTLSNWRFGIPQTIGYPATPDTPSGSSESVVVNDNGWIASLTDEAGFTTGYGYDAMGRINSVTFPAGDSVPWNPISQSFQKIGSAARGLPAGHWRLTRTQGNRGTYVYYDALWQPVLTETVDLTSGNVQTQVAKRYDVDGQPVFESYPSRTITDFRQALPGTTTAYDGLGRARSVRQDSELGVLTTSTEYLGNLQARVTNPRLQATTTTYQAFDQPQYETPLSIARPEGQNIQIVRDLFGKPRSLRQYGPSADITRSFVYDAYQRLCKRIEPEAGATVMDYDAAGNLLWTAAGIAAPATDDCSRTTAGSSGRVASRTYDARNRLRTLTFPDGRGNQSWSYTADGLATSVTTSNDGVGQGQVVNTYQYNRRRLLTSETVTLPSGYAWSIGYQYDRNAAVAGHTLPDGLQVNYAPDALGRPTQAGSYASAVSYHPNGGMAGFTYGNGIVHTLVQNARGLPDRSRDVKGSSVVLDDGYDYDANGNVAAITDGVAGNRGNRTMGYDGLDRLTSTVSPMFSPAAYTYDGVDNLRTVRIAGRDHSYVYDGSNRLTNVRNVADGATVVGIGYDVQGNLNNRNGVVHQFDYGNRLREVNGREKYRYDAHGRRVWASSATLGDIYSMYGQDGVLRFQRDQRKQKDISYVLLNGSLVAQVSKASVPDVPSLTVPSYLNQGSFSVSWTAVAMAARYELEESANGAAWQAKYSGTALSSAISGKATGSYAYRVRACTSELCGAWSASKAVSIELPPGTAPALTVPANGYNGAYRVQWTSASGATTYALEQSFNGGAWAAAYSGAALLADFSGKGAGSYAYRVRGCNPIGCGPYSATGTVQVIYPPAAMASVTAPALSNNGSYTASWAAVSGATSYQLEENANGTGWLLLQNTAATSRAISGKSAGSYQYRARACNGAGCGGYSATATVSVVFPPSTAPSISGPSLSPNGSYTVTWAGVATATSYRLEESANGGAWALAYNGAGGSHGVSGRGNGTYQYRVQACNAGGCGPYSGLLAVQVLLPPPTPAGPSMIWETWRSPGQPVRSSCHGSWSAVPTASTYEVNTWGTSLGKLVYSGPNTYVSASSSTCGYQYVMRACNASGCSAYSAPADVTKIDYNDEF